MPTWISKNSETAIENLIKGVFVVSSQQLLLSLSHDEAKLSTASQCFQELEYCPFGVTVAFWLAVHQLPSPPASSSSSGSQSWRLFDLHGETSSSLSVTLENQSGFSLKAVVKLLNSASLNENKYEIWKITVSFFT